MDRKVPPVIFSDELILFRSMLNCLTNSCNLTGFGLINMNLSVSTSEHWKDVFVDIKHYSSLFTSKGGEKISNESNYVPSRGSLATLEGIMAIALNLTSSHPLLKPLIWKILIAAAAVASGACFGFCTNPFVG
jgi:hypothetical protein